MFIQDMIAKLDNPVQDITIECISTQETIETNAYLCKRLLYTAERVSADNIKLTVSEDVFKGIKKHLTI